MRPLEARPSAPATPIRKVSQAKIAATPEPESAQKAPTALEVQQLSDVTLEDGPSLQMMSKQAEGGKLDGTVLEHEEVSKARLRAIQWLMGQFAAFGFRDEWLAEAISYMDRIAVGANSQTDGSSSSSQAGADYQSARKVMASKDVWLATVQIALKMSEAEPELDSSIQHLMMPLVNMGWPSSKCDRSSWQQILNTEMVVIRRLDFKFLAATPLQLVNFISLGLCRSARKKWSGSQPADDLWPGFKSGHLPQLLGPQEKDKELQEKRKDMALPPRPICFFEALASFLTELTLVHRPAEAYGNGKPVDVLVIAVLQLALYGFGAPPPESLHVMLREIQGKILPPERASENLLLTMRAAVYRLWSQLPDGSPVVQKWQLRKSLLGSDIPGAPSKEELPAALLKSCSVICTPSPQRRQQDVKDDSATPCPPCRPQAQTNLAVEGTFEASEPQVKVEKVAAKVVKPAEGLPSEKVPDREDYEDNPPSSPPSTALDTPSGESGSPGSAAAKKDEKPAQTKDETHEEKPTGAEPEMAAKPDMEAEFANLVALQKARKADSSSTLQAKAQANGGVGIAQWVHRHTGQAKPPFPKRKQPETVEDPNRPVKKRTLGHLFLRRRRPPAYDDENGAASKAVEDRTTASDVVDLEAQQAADVQAMLAQARPLATASQATRPAWDRGVKAVPAAPLQPPPGPAQAPASEVDLAATRQRQLPAPHLKAGTVRMAKAGSHGVRVAGFMRSSASVSVRRSNPLRDARSRPSYNLADVVTPKRKRTPSASAARKVSKAAKSASGEDELQKSENSQQPQVGSVRNNRAALDPMAPFANRADPSRGPITVPTALRHTSRGIRMQRQTQPYAISVAQVPQIPQELPAQQLRNSPKAEVSSREEDEEKARSLSLSVSPATQRKILSLIPV